MIIFPDMNKNTFRFAYKFLLVVLPFIISCSCKKNQTDPVNPTVVIANHSSGDDTLLIPGQSLTLLIDCKGNGEDALTNFFISNNGVRFVDEGFFKTEYSKQLVFTKDTATQNALVFTIRDKNGNSATASYNVLKSEGNAGELLVSRNVVLGAQKSTAGGSFMNVKSGAVFAKAEAATIPANIHLLCYYSTFDTDEMVIASPGANIDYSVYGDGGPTDWTVKNTTRFTPITLSFDQFNGLTQVEDLVSLYSDISGKRKAKNLIVGNAFSFKQEELGLYGVFIVTAVVSGEAGSVVVDVMVQKMKNR